MLRWIFWTLCTIPLLFSVVQGAVWDGINGRMGSMVAGATPIEAIGPLKEYQAPHKRHLGLHGLEGGNATILVHQSVPPLFLLTRKQLYYYVNETTMYPVNVYNTTLEHRPPLQLKVDSGKNKGLKGGVWRWQGSQLHYDYPGNVGTQGVFWSCVTQPGRGLSSVSGVFLFHKEEHWIDSCNALTLHSFGQS